MEKSHSKITSRDGQICMTWETCITQNRKLYVPMSFQCQLCYNVVLCSITKNAYKSISYISFFLWSNDNIGFISCNNLLCFFLSIQELAVQRSRYTESLLDFVQLATKELMWLDEKEEAESSRDWSAKNLDMGELQRHYNVRTDLVLGCLEAAAGCSQAGWGVISCANSLHTLGTTGLPS